MKMALKSVSIFKSQNDRYFHNKCALTKKLIPTITSNLFSNCKHLLDKKSYNHCDVTYSCAHTRTREKIRDIKRRVKERAASCKMADTVQVLLMRLPAINQQRMKS
jgi:hypothetical protein